MTGHLPPAVRHPEPPRRKRGALHTLRDEHRSLSAMLLSLRQMIQRGPEDEPNGFFDVARAMLFYIDEFPERRHHPQESQLLFPILLRAAPALHPVIARLEQEHSSGQQRARELQHLLLAWELLGESRRQAFEQEAAAYVAFYLEHMRVEEREVIAVAERVLSGEQLQGLDNAFSHDSDPLTAGMDDPRFERLFTRIVLRAPAPIGLGGG